MAALLMKNGSIECHVLGRNLVALKKVQNLLSVKEAEHIVRALSAQAFPGIRIDVVHHKGDVCL